MSSDTESPRVGSEVLGAVLGCAMGASGALNPAAAAATVKASRAQRGDAAPGAPGKRRVHEVVEGCINL
jgi:hypothetical protein